MNYAEFKNTKQVNVPSRTTGIKTIEEYNGAQEQLREFERNYNATREDWEQLQKVFDELIDNLKYDGDKIDTCAEALDWKYFNCQNRTININDVVENATRLFEDICTTCNGTGTMSSGGITVKSNIITKHVLVNFELSSNQAFWDEESNTVEY